MCLGVSTWMLVIVGCFPEAIRFISLDPPSVNVLFIYLFYFVSSFLPNHPCQPMLPVSTPNLFGVGQHLLYVGTLFSYKVTSELSNLF